METKLIEIRDDATFIPALAIRGSGTESWLLRAAGFGGNRPYVLLVKLRDLVCEYDPFAWTGRTMKIAHGYLVENWDHLKDGDMIDVRTVLGEQRSNPSSESEHY